MEELDVFNRMKNGDSTAFEEWMESHALTIERLTIQYGFNPNQASEVAERTFRSLYNHLNDIQDEAQLLFLMYQTAIKEIGYSVPLHTEQESILPFEEDQRLQNKITKFEHNNKLSLILSQFHGMNETEISTLIGISEALVLSSITETYQKLNRNKIQLEKQLKFLGRSYGRIGSSFNKENVFQKVKEEKTEPVQQKPVLSKKIMLSWIAGIITLIALITVSVVTGEEYKKSSTEKYVEGLKESFENEVATKFEELGLVESIDQDGYIFNVSYAETTRNEFDIFINRIDRQIRKNERLDKNQIKEDYDSIIDMLLLPSEMAEQLFKNPLTNDQLNSEIFIDEYIEKIMKIQESHFLIYINNHQQVIEDEIVDGVLNVEEFLKKKETLPEEFQRSIEGAIKQNFYPVSINDWLAFAPKYQANEFSAKIRQSLHENVGGYMTLLEMEPLHYSVLTSSVEELTGNLIEMENSILASINQPQKNSYQMLMQSYIALLNYIVIGSESNHIYDSNDRVKKEYRTAWERLASLEERSPSGFIMRQIIAEMNASNWQESKSLSRLEYHHLHELVEIAQANDLSTFTFDEIIYETLTTDVRDSGYKNNVEEVYNVFSDGFDSAVLADVNPLIIMGVYYFANELEDSTTMWHLLNRDYISISLEEYRKNWTKADSVLEDAEMLMAEMVLSRLNGAQHIPISYQIENSTFFIGLMVLDEEANVWTIQEIY